MNDQGLSGLLRSGDGRLRRAIAIIHYPPPVNDASLMPQLVERMVGEARNARLLYIHIPFCEAFCPFCPYPKTVLESRQAVARYLDALKKEADHYIGLGSCARPYAVHFGGGTPSSLLPEELERLLGWLGDRFGLSETKEITFEANPLTLTEEKLSVLVKGGVTRVSLGTQTFNDQLGEHIGLRQKAAETEKAIRLCREAGVDTVNLDLMYNLPGQKLEDFEEDLRRAVEAGADGVSLFPLKLIPGLPLYNDARTGKLPEKGDLEFEKKLYSSACEQLLKAKMCAESTYDFARPGKSHLYRQIHFSPRPLDVLALGMAAVGEVNGIVYRNYKSMDEYLKRINEGELPVLRVSERTNADLKRRFLVAGFWSLCVKRGLYREQFGKNPEKDFPSLFNELAEKKLVKQQDDSWKYTQEGLFWGNNICRAFCAKKYKEEPL